MSSERARRGLHSQGVIVAVRFTLVTDSTISSSRKKADRWQLSAHHGQTESQAELT